MSTYVKKVHAERMDKFRNPLAAEHIHNWLKFSMNPRSYNEIVTQYFKDLEENTDTICYAYICRYSNLTEEEIDKIGVLSTGVIHDIDDLRYMPQLIDYLYAEKDNQRVEPQVLKINICTEFNFVKHGERLDWFNICMYQKLSEEFMHRHRFELYWKQTLSCQKMSKEFKLAHLEYITWNEQQHFDDDYDD